MLVKKATVILTLAIVFIIGVVADETSTLVPGRQSTGLPSASNKGFFTEQFPFQLLSPQFGNLVALLSNLSQSLNKPQSGQPTIEGNAIVSKLGKANLADFNFVPGNASYSTLPFNELNQTEFSWIWENLLGNGMAGKNLTLEIPNQEEVGLGFQPRLFGGGNTTYADLNFLTVPQLFNLFGR